MAQESAGQPPQNPHGPTRGPRGWPWRWITLGALTAVIVAAVVVGVGSYWWFAEKVETANERTAPEVQGALDTKPSTTLVTVTQQQTTAGSEVSEAMNIILLGSETTGTSTGSAGRSSTIMVLHVDPKLDFACLLSVPRDLYVDIPGHGKNRINAAYNLGGPQLTIRTVKEVLGLDIAKYVEIDFDAFARAIDSLGGVYVDVDRRYEGSAAHPIKLEPGYQLLNGADALAFARYRFDKNGDPGRMTRQQRVLTAVREQASGWDLAVKVPGIAGPILDATATNLSANEILKVAYWLVKLDGERMSQIFIKGTGQTIDGKTVLVADQQTIAEAVTDLLTAPAADSTGGPSTTGAGGDSTTPTTKASGSTATTSKEGTAAVSDSDMWKAAQTAVPFALQAPGFIPVGFSYAYKKPATEGTYQIEPGSDSKPAVRVLYRYGDKDLYLGVTATTWTDAPAAGDGRKVESDGVTYTVVGTSGKVDRIWWKKDGVLYFISNTLTYDVSRDDLLKMAGSMAPVSGD